MTKGLDGTRTQIESWNKKTCAAISHEIPNWKRTVGYYGWFKSYINPLYLIM